MLRIQLFHLVSVSVLAHNLTIMKSINEHHITSHHCHIILLAPSLPHLSPSPLLSSSRWNWGVSQPRGKTRRCLVLTVENYSKKYFLIFCTIKARKQDISKFSNFSNKHLHGQKQRSLSPAIANISTKNCSGRVLRPDLRHSNIFSILSHHKWFLIKCFYVKIYLGWSYCDVIQYYP